jgi:hypothetical protein
MGFLLTEILVLLAYSQGKPQGGHGLVAMQVDIGRMYYGIRAEEFTADTGKNHRLV